MQQSGGPSFSRERRGSATAGASAPARPTSSSQFRGPLARCCTPQQAAECKPRRTVKKIVSQLFLWNTHFLYTWNSARRSPSRKGIKEETDRQPGWMGLHRVPKRRQSASGDLTSSEPDRPNLCFLLHSPKRSCCSAVVHPESGSA
jgi:hypothetical protein